MSSKFRKAVEEYKEVSLKLQDLFADRAKALEGYKKASGDEKEKYKMELSRIQKLVTPLQNQMEKAERVFNKALLSEPEELEEGSGDGAYALKALTGHQIGQDTAAEFLSKHNVNLEKLKKAVVQRVIDKYELKDVIMGKAHKLVTKNFIKDYVKEGNDDGLERVAAGLPQTEEEPVNESASSVIKAGDSVTIRTPQKQMVSGKAVMKSPHGGWTLNMGGKHGRPGSADDRNIVKVTRGGKVIFSVDKEIKALEDKIKAVKGKTPADLGKKAAMQDDIARLKAMNEANINEVSRRAKEMFDDTKFGQEIHKMLKGKWDAKKVKDYLDGQGGGSTQKHLRIIDFISKDAGLNPRKYDNQTLGKHISDLVDKLEVLYKDFTKGTDVKKFDDVHIKSKNLTGIVYAISGNTLVVKTASGMVKTTKDDVEAVMSDGVIKEGNAFGMAVTQAKKEGKKEFEFNGKTYKVKKGKGKVNESDCGCGSKVVVSEAVKEPEVITKLRDIVKKRGYASVRDPKLGKSVKVDIFSASAIIQVYDALNDTNKEKFAEMSIPKMAEVAFKLAKK